MRDEQTQYFVGLDIGTSMIRCVVGTADPDDPSRPAVVGHGQSVNQGMRKGVVAHIEDVIEAINTAVSEAERVSGFDINQATININGGHVRGINSRGVIAISTANREIGDDDRLRVEEAATIVNLPPNREIIQVFAKNYRIDGQDNIKDPVGMHGVRLEVDTHIVTASTPNINTMYSMLDKTNITPAHITISGLAAAEAALSRQQKEAGTLVVDIGASTTNLAVIEDGEVQYIGVIPVGGIHLTNDLAIGLKTDLDIAEKIKIEHSTLVEKAKTGTIKVKHGKDQHQFSGEDVAMITEARMEELFELIDKELKKIHKAGRLPGGVVLVGGVSKTPGIVEFAKEKLQLPARLGRLQPLGGIVDTVSDQRYITAVGLMLLDMFLMPDKSGTNRRNGLPNDRVFGAVESVWGKIKKRVNR